VYHNTSSFVDNKHMLIFVHDIQRSGIARPTHRRFHRSRQHEVLALGHFVFSARRLSVEGKRTSFNPGL
jgi:hypothetical protein